MTAYENLKKELITSPRTWMITGVAGFIGSNLLDPDTLADWRKDAVRQVDEAVAAAQKEAVPEADKEDWCALSRRDLFDRVDEE